MITSLKNTTVFNIGREFVLSYNVLKLRYLLAYFSCNYQVLCEINWCNDLILLIRRDNDNLKHVVTLK